MGAAVTLSRYGLSVPTETGWETRIYRRTPGGDGEVTHPVLHACTRPMPADRGDFGDGLVELLGPDDIFVALVEYGVDVAGTGLFARQVRPRLAPSQLSPNRLPRAVPGRSAAQHFFTEGDRAFCLFVVVGSHARRMALVPRAQQVVSGLKITSKQALLRQGALP